MSSRRVAIGRRSIWAEPQPRSSPGRPTRSAQEITVAFDTLQQELSVQISSQVMRTHQQLLENFDEDVTLKVKTKSEQALSDYERKLMLLTRHELEGLAEFRGDESFVLIQSRDSVQAETGL